MKKVCIFFFALIYPVVLMQGCGGGGSDSSSPALSEVSAAGGLVDLGDLVAPAGDHWYYTEAVGINDNGLVIGWSNDNGTTTRGAFSWDPATNKMTSLDMAPSAVFSKAVDINNRDEVIVNSIDKEGNFVDTHLWRGGTSIQIPGDKSNDINEKGEVVGGFDCDVEFCTDAFYWDGVSGQISVLGRAADADDAEAVAINENSQVVINSGGTVVFHDLNHHVAETLNHLPGAVKTVAVDINDSIYTNNDGIPDGHVIGNSGNFDLEALEKAVMGKAVRAVVQQGGPTQQPDENPSADEILFGTQPPGTASDFLFGTDELDGVVTQLPGEVVVGESFEWDVTDVQGFFWDGGAMYPISGFGQGVSAVTDLNNNDEVVGGATTADGKTHAFLWTLNENGAGVVRDLGTLGGQHSFALAINEAGQIVGWSTTGEFYTEEGLYMPIIHGFLWENGRMYDLGAHNNFYNYPFTPSYPFSVAVDINEPGELTGNSLTINAHSRGFYSQAGASAP